MRTLIIILAILLMVSLGINAWTLSQLSSVKKQLADQERKVASLVEEIKGIKQKGSKRKRRPEPEREVVVAFDDDPVKGDSNAPVTIIEFSDYQCPFCRRFHNEVLPSIEKKYISTGKVRYIFRDFPLGFHKQAIPAAVAANCAGEQGKYWEMNDFLFKNPSKLDVESTLAAAKELGLDYAKFEECMTKNREKHEEEIKKDLEDGKRYGVKGTPSFFIGNTGSGTEMKAIYLRGLRPFSSLKPYIEKLLKEDSK